MRNPPPWLEPEADPNAPWFPGLAERLARDLWSRAPSGFSPDTYGSARWLTADPRTIRETIAAIEVGDGLCRVERLPREWALRYETIGLDFAELGPIDEATALVTTALGELGIVPSVGAAVSALLRSLHLLTSAGEGFDISHSDPELPFSIFVSAPVGQPDAAARLAESILHEAMHLELSLAERSWPLVSEPEASGFSPWQRRERPLSGLLHGLFVFTAVRTFGQERLADPGLAARERAYHERRGREIASEIEAVAELEFSPGLTREGRALASFLLASNRGG